MKPMKALWTASLAAVVAVLVVAAIAALGPAQVSAQQSDWDQPVTGVTVSPGDNPGELDISWDAHPAGPQDYRVKWAPVDEDYRRWGDRNWNAYLSSTSHTVTGLTEGATYKAQVLARTNTPERLRAPWSAEVTGDAALAPDPVPADDRADDVSLGDITELSTTESITGQVNRRGDTEDYFGFSLTEPKDVAVTLSGLDVDANLFIEDDSGNVIHESVNQGVEDDSISATLASGAYFFRVVAVAYGSNDYELSYALSEASTTIEVTDDYSADSSTGASITLDVDGAGSATGSIESAGDIDWFAVELTVGQEYWIEVLAGPSESGTLAAPTLPGVYDADSTVVSNGSVGGDGVEPKIAFTPTATATYFIAAAAYRNEGGFYEFGATGTYKVTVAHTDSSEDDFSAFTDTTGELVAGGAAVRAELEAVGDYDWFGFDAEAGRRYSVSFAGFSQGKGTLRYGHAYGVFDSAGDLAEGAKFSYNGVHHFDPSESGTYYVGVRAIPGWVDADDVTGTYRVKLSERVLVWSSPMTVGIIDSSAPNGMGYTTWTHPRSAMGDRNFELDGDRYGILAVMHFAGGLYLSTSRPLPNKFTFDWTRTTTLNGDEKALVGSSEFAAVNSSIPAMRGEGRYWWPIDLIGWTVGDDLEVSITTAVDPKPLSDRPLARPTAHFSSIPESHDSREIFTVELIFPETMDLTAESLRDHSLDVANGSVSSVEQRKNAKLSIWVISVQPDSIDDVTISLSSAGACDQAGSVCTPDGRKLRNEPSVTVPTSVWSTVALDALNGASRGVWSDGTTLWVADSEADKIFAYDLTSGGRDAARDIDTIATGNTQSRGIWSDGTTMWVADGSRDKVFAYDLASGARDAASDINNLARVGNSRPLGIWSDGATMWVADDGNDMLYVYSLVRGVRPVGRSIVSLNGAGNNDPKGIWSDGTTMWVADNSDDKVYAYDLASGARDAARDIDTLSDTATTNPWGLWSDGVSMLVVSIDQGHLAHHDIPAAPEPTGWTIGSGCTVDANAPEPTEVAVDAIPIVVSSTTDDYFVLYASFDVDGETWEMPVAVVLGEAGTTTLAENAEALAQDRYRIEKYLVADPADVDGDCVDDITELENLSVTSPVNAAPAIDRRDGSVSVPNLNAFLAKAYTRPYEFTGTESASGVKILVTDMDTDRPGLYFLDYHSYSYHVLVLHELGLESVDVEGLITYDPSRAAPDGSVGAYYLNLGMGVYSSFSEVERLYTLIAANMAHIDDDLYVHFGNDVLPELQPEASLYEASRIDILLDDDVFAEASFVSMNPGVGFGQLRIQSPDDRPHPRDIVIYETLPNELPRVAGIITTVQQTPLSHVNLRAIQNEIPNAYVQDATNDADITDLTATCVTR